MKIGSPAPAFSLPASTGRTLSLKDFAGQRVVVYFYPSDDTPTCTKQACAFRDALQDYRAVGAAVLGVSTDSVASHERFIAKYKLPFVLLADEDHAVAEKYGVWQLKTMFGNTYMGIVRSTFVIDSRGRLAAEFRNIRLKGHMEKVLEAVQRAS